MEASVLIRVGLIRLEMDQLEAAEQVFEQAKDIVQETRDPVRMFELQAGLARISLARHGMDSLELARGYIQELADEILHEPPTEQSHFLPMGLYITCLRVMKACDDPCTGQLLTRANAELQARLSRIPDEALRSTFMNIADHRAIVGFAAGNLEEA